MPCAGHAARQISHIRGVVSAIAELRPLGRTSLRDGDTAPRSDRHRRGRLRVDGDARVAARLDLIKLAG